MKISSLAIQLLFLSSSVISQNHFASNDTLAITKDIELENMLVDDTHSKIGKDFYDALYSIWEFPKTEDSHTITISEKISPRMGSFISISIDDNELTSQFLSTNYDFILEFAQNTAAYLKQYLEIYNDIQSELQGKDLKGTGIF